MNYEIIDVNMYTRTAMIYIRTYHAAQKQIDAHTTNCLQKKTWSCTCTQCCCLQQTCLLMLSTPAKVFA